MADTLERYNRQAYALGQSAMTRLASAHVLIVGLCPVGVECAKNLILAGVRAVYLCDPSPISRLEQSANPFLNDDDFAGTTAAAPRAAVLSPRLAALNPYVSVTVVPTLEDCVVLLKRIAEEEEERTTTSGPGKTAAAAAAAAVPVVSTTAGSRHQQQEASRQQKWVVVLNNPWLLFNHPPYDDCHQQMKEDDAVADDEGRRDLRLTSSWWDLPDAILTNVRRAPPTGLVPSSVFAAADPQELPIVVTFHRGPFGFVFDDFGRRFVVDEPQESDDSRYFASGVSVEARVDAWDPITGEQESANADAPASSLSSRGGRFELRLKLDGIQHDPLRDGEVVELTLVTMMGRDDDDAAAYPAGIMSRGAEDKAEREDNAPVSTTTTTTCMARVKRQISCNEALLCGVAADADGDRHNEESNRATTAEKTTTMSAFDLWCQALKRPRSDAVQTAGAPPGNVPPPAPLGSVYVRRVASPRVMAFAPFVDAISDASLFGVNYAKDVRVMRALCATAIVAQRGPARRRAWNAVRSTFSSIKGLLDRAGEGTEAAEQHPSGQMIAPYPSLSLEEAALCAALCHAGMGEAAGTAAIIGAVATQEAMKAVTGKFIPLQQFWFHDARELLLRKDPTAPAGQVAPSPPPMGQSAVADDEGHGYPLLLPHCLATYREVMDALRKAVAPRHTAAPSMWQLHTADFGDHSIGEPQTQQPPRTSSSSPPSTTHLWLVLSLPPAQRRYSGLVPLIGRAALTALANSHLFVVGAGAIGCEYMKALALSGAGTQPKGRITITDNDRIEASNLCRQFLFRDHHVGQYKAVVAATVVKESINSKCKIRALSEKVGPLTCDPVEGTFNGRFWSSLSVVLTAVDNMQARSFLDTACMRYALPFIDAGTQGALGHVEVFVPFVTHRFSDARVDDGGAGAIPFCTLHFFPTTMAHCVQYAMDLFAAQFSRPVDEVNRLAQSLRGGGAASTRAVGHSASPGAQLEEAVYRHFVSLPPADRERGLSTVVSLLEASRSADSHRRSCSQADAPEMMMREVSLRNHEGSAVDHSQQGAGGDDGRLDQPGSPLAGCLQWARDVFDRCFVFPVVDLLHTHPPDDKTAEGDPFWTTSRKRPQYQPFDPRCHPDHAGCLCTLAVLRGQMLQLPAAECWASHWLPAALANPVLALQPLITALMDRPVYTPRRIPGDAAGGTKAVTAADTGGGIVPTTDDAALEAALRRQTAHVASLLGRLHRIGGDDHACQPNGGTTGDGEAVAKQQREASTGVVLIRECAALLERNYRSLTMDKDVDSHASFVTFAANVRAATYGIPRETKSGVRKLAGRIVPALITTTAMVTGMATIELFKRFICLERSGDRHGGTIAAAGVTTGTPPSPTAAVGPEAVAVGIEEEVGGAPGVAMLAKQRRLASGMHVSSNINLGYMDATQTFECAPPRRTKLLVLRPGLERTTRGPTTTAAAAAAPSSASFSFEAASWQKFVIQGERGRTTIREVIELFKAKYSGLVITQLVETTTNAWVYRDEGEAMVSSKSDGGKSARSSASQSDFPLALWTDRWVEEDKKRAAAKSSHDAALPDSARPPPPPFYEYVVTCQFPDASSTFTVAESLPLLRFDLS